MNPLHVLFSLSTSVLSTLLGVKGVDKDETCEGGSRAGIEQYKHFH